MTSGTPYTPEPVNFGSASSECLVEICCRLRPLATSGGVLQTPDAPAGHHFYPSWRTESWVGPVEALWDSW